MQGWRTARMCPGSGKVAMLGLFLENTPREQLLMGVFLLLAGLVIFPAMLALLMPVVNWMNSPWADANWWLAGWRYTKGLMVLACCWFVLLGAGRLAVYSFAKAGLIVSPW